MARKLRVIAVVGDAAGPDGMVGGQAIDLQAAGQAPGHAVTLDAEGLRAMHARKTGALIRASAVSGAIMAGAADDVVFAIDRYAGEVGLAFQIVDDCLDCAGQTVETGKIAGTDLREGIPTLPLLLAAREDPVVRAALAGGPLEGALLRVAASGAVDEARQVARTYVERARACLEGLDTREELDAIADAVVERTA